MKKNISVLIVRRHAGEVDWILPLLYRFKINGNKIITIFSDQMSFESLRNNIEIYNIWKSISKDYFIVRKYHSFYWKTIHFIIRKFNLSRLDLIKNLEKFILNKTFDIKLFAEKFKTKISQVNSVFVTSNHFSYLPLIFKNINSNILIIRFPEATMIASSKKENPNVLYNTSFNNIYGDIFLFSSKTNKEFFLGKFETKNLSKKIYYCGFLRYEKWWIDKIVKKKKIKKRKFFTILVPIRDPNLDYFHHSSYLEIIESIMKIAKKINKCKIIFKIHPQNTNINLLKNVLKKFNSNLWELKKNHMLNLSSQANMCISIITSACLDSLALRIPTIEFYKINSELVKSPNVTTCVHMAYLKKKKKWVTIFNYKGLVNTVEDYKALEKKVDLIYKNQYKKTCEKNYFSFRNLIKFNKNNSNKIYKIINKKIMKMRTLN